MARLSVNPWDPWGDWLFRSLERPSALPALNVFFNDSEVIVTSEIPGLNPDDLDIQVCGESLSLKGAIKASPSEEGTWHRRERFAGEVYRSVRLPYSVDSDKVQASYAKGVLEIRLPRAEADRPRKISLKTA